MKDLGNHATSILAAISECPDVRVRTVYIERHHATVLRMLQELVRDVREGRLGELPGNTGAEAAESPTRAEDHGGR